MPTDETATVCRLLQQVLRGALRAAAPEVCLPPFLERSDTERPALVLGAGKAAAAMAAAFRVHWRGSVRGLVVTRYGHGLAAGEDAGAIEVIEAGHPAPDEASLTAGSRLLDVAAGVRPDETVWCLISGGGSALAVVPLPGLGLARKRRATGFLLRRGADIREINCVRKHLSGLKGGRLAMAAHPAPVVTLAISDVPGDDAADIASGPTIPDRSTQAQARAVLERYEYPELDELLPVLADPTLESPKPGDAAFAADRVHVIARAATALEEAERTLREHGYEVRQLGDDLDGEARSVGREHARLAREALAAGSPVAILSGGETRVALGERSGRGGRNLEYLAALALELRGCPGVYALAADTDGIDGHGDHAGGMVVPDFLTRGAAVGLSLEALLEESDSYRYFDACNLLLKTGPTRTNVNDFRLILCHP